MSDDIYLETLSWFKQIEKPEVVLLIADDSDLIRIVVAWTSMKVGPSNKLTEMRGRSDQEMWEWLWRNTEYSKTALIQKTGVSYSESGLDSKLKPLIENRILYPDGTVNSFVQRYLRDRVLKLFGSKSKRPTSEA